MLTKTLKAEGRTIYYFDNEDRRVIHNFDGPAIIYDNKTKDEYWLYGKQMTKEEFKEAHRDFNGIPPSKDSRYEQSMR